MFTREYTFFINLSVIVTRNICNGLAAESVWASSRCCTCLASQVAMLSHLGLTLFFWQEAVFAELHMTITPGVAEVDPSYT